MKILLDKKLVLLLLILGIVFAGQGAYIQLKAVLSQYLLEDAWTRTLQGESRVKPWPWADTWPVARLEFPGGGVHLVILSGATGRTLAFGPGQLAGSAAPGDAGVSIISGHRDTHFRFLKDIRIGDRINIQSRDGQVHRFEITSTRIVDSRRALLPTESLHPALAMITCYPFDALQAGSPYRYVVIAEAVDDVPRTPVMTYRTDT
jgi:sortase A